MNLEDKAGDKAEKIIRLLRQYEPRIKHPQKLTDDIMASLNDVDQTDNAPGKIKRRIFLMDINFRRMVAAAAILLMGLLGYEQYLVLDKINRLEIQLEKAAVNKKPSSTATYMNSWEANAMISFRKIKSNNKSLTEKVREVREMMKAIDSNASSQSNSYRDRTIKKYNRMIMR